MTTEQIILICVCAAALLPWLPQVKGFRPFLHNSTYFLNAKIVACCRGSGCLLLSSCYHNTICNTPLKPQLFTMLSPLPCKGF